MSLATPFRWPGRSREAAALLARGETWDATAAQLHVTRRQLSRWHLAPEFQAEVERLKQQIADAITAEGIANRQNRIAAQNRRWQLLEQIREERAADDSMARVPGGTTGLVVRQVKQIGTGKDAEAVEEYAVDTPTLREWRELEKQAAQETGQWTEKRELSGKNGAPLVFTVRIGERDDAGE